MEIKTEIICKDFEQRKIDDNNKIYNVKKSEEYYVIPLNKSFEMEYDDTLFKLTFKNQELWLKYSNRFKELLLKTTHYTEFVLIKSKDIIDIYVKIIADNYFRKNIWTTQTTVHMNKKYLEKHFIVIPIINDMIDIREFGEKIPILNIEMITNEVLLRKVTPYAKHGHLSITSNFLLNKDALFIKVNDDELNKFYE